MRLDELPWSPVRAPGTEQKAHMRLPRGTWLYILGANNSYDIYHDKIEHTEDNDDVICSWIDVDALMAQCIVYELFGITHSGNNGGEDGDTGKAA